MIIGSAALGATGGLGIWALLADARLVPGRSVIDTVLARCDVDFPPPPDGDPDRVLAASFYSAHRKRTVRYQIIYPPVVKRGVKLPVCVYLHDFGGDEKEAQDRGLDRVVAGLVNSGLPGFALVTIDGGDRNWHPRADGDDPLRMVVEDLPNVLRQYNLLVTDKMAIMGTAAGGYGALLAASEAPERYFAVTANSPALWHSFDDSQDARPTAFDSADDWRSYGDLRPRVEKLKNVKVRIDCGTSDEFESNLRTLADLLPRDTVRFAPGCHDQTFWRSVASAQLNEIGLLLLPLQPQG